MNRLQMKRQNDPAFFPIVSIIPATPQEGRVHIGDVHSLDINILQRQNVKAIVSCSKQCDSKTKLGEYAKEVRILQINIRDTVEDNIGKYFDDAYSFIQRGRKQGSVLVQCMAGISRSSAIILAYMMRKLGVNLDNALAYIKTKRPKVNPNEGFMRQLRLYEKDLGVAQSKRPVDLEEMKENISANTPRPKIARQTMVPSREPPVVESATKQKNAPVVIKYAENRSTHTPYETKRSRSHQPEPQPESAQSPKPVRRKTEQAILDDDEPQNTRLQNLKAEVAYMEAKLRMSRFGQMIYDY